MRNHSLWFNHGLQTPREEIAFTARPKIQSQSQIYRYGRSIFCLPHRPKFSDIFDFCLHCVSVVRAYTLADSGFFKNFLYQGGVKSTVSWVFEDLKFKISEGYDQNWCFPDSAQLAVSATLIPNLVKPLICIYLS